MRKECSAYFQGKAKLDRLVLQVVFCLILQPSSKSPIATAKYEDMMELKSLQKFVLCGTSLMFKGYNWTFLWHEIAL